MKKIFRMIVFSGVAIYLTSLWNRGFIVDFSWQNFLLSCLIIAFLYYLVKPITKMLLLPLNFLTFGFISTIAYFFLFHFVISYFSLIAIEAWTFNSYQIGYYVNVCLVAFSTSFIISFLEEIL